MILVCAATRTEAAACRRGAEDAGARGLEVLHTGVGPDRAAAALAARLATGRPTLVVSAGFAGALHAGLAPLAWVTASALFRVAGGRAVPVPLAPGLLRIAPDAAQCAVVSAAEVVAGEVADAPAPAVVDMESAALAEIAAAARVPFLVLRMVTDTPARPLAPVARSLGAALGVGGPLARAVHGARAALEAARAPGDAARLVRDGIAWRDALRIGWRARAGGLR